MTINKIVFFLLILLVCAGFSTFFQLDSEWQLKKYENNVAVYNREIPNSNIKELKAETQIKTSLSSVIALLNDRETYPQWVYKCGKSIMLKKISESEAIYYQTVLAPWPVDNRDFVVDVKVLQDAVTKEVKQYSTCLPTYIPPFPGHVRITVFNAVWTLTPLKNGMVKCEYELLVDPGGNVPAWLVNLAAIDGPFETTLNLREWALKEKYKKAQFPFIKEQD